MEMMMGCKVERHSPARIGKKISILMHEGTPQKQAEAMALSMEREHRLTDSGGYIRAKKKPGKKPSMGGM
jgi:hypothetical protein